VISFSSSTLNIDVPEEPGESMYRYSPVTARPAFENQS
jgi:hypothetical protein